jgi:hypothetical protein
MGYQSTTIRPARADEASALTDVVLKPKAHWGYDADFMAACRDELTIVPEEVVARRIVVAEAGWRVVGANPTTGADNWSDHEPRRRDFP